MTTIRNINPNFGDSVTFSGPTIDAAVAAMADAISACRPEELVEGRDYAVVPALTYVRTTEGLYLIQVPDETPYGFSLRDDEQSWPGGFGIATDWIAVPPSEVPAEIRDSLDYLLVDHETAVPVSATPGASRR